MGEPGRSQQDTGVEAKQAPGEGAQAAGVGVAVKLSLRLNAQTVPLDTVLRLCPWIHSSGTALGHCSDAALEHCSKTDLAHCSGLPLAAILRLSSLVSAAAKKSYKHSAQG